MSVGMHSHKLCHMTRRKCVCVFVCVCVCVCVCVLRREYLNTPDSIVIPKTLDISLNVIGHLVQVKKALEDFSTIYWNGCHLSHMTRTIQANFISPAHAERNNQSN